MLVADLSLHGMRLHGTSTPALGAWVSLALALPRGEVPAVGHVVWTDRSRAAIGVQLERGSEHHDRELGAAILGLAMEAESGRPGALVLVDDPTRAALLCESLRRHGYLPQAVRTPLDAIRTLHASQPAIKLAIVAHHALGLTGNEVDHFLESEYPDVPRISVEDPIPVTDDLGDGELDTALAHVG